MRFVRGYSLPFLLTLSGGIASLSDILQNQFIAYTLGVCLLVIGGIVFVSDRSASLSNLVLDAVPHKFRKSFSAGEFALSCSVMAMFVFGFATLSARAADDGGIIAHAYPEIRDLQADLGIVQEVVAALDVRTQQIDATTKEIAAASDKWIGVTQVSVYSPGVFLMHVTVENRSTFLFDNVRIVGRRPSEPAVINEGEFIMAPNSQEQHSREFSDRPEAIEVCVSGQRRSDGVWSREHRTYGNPSSPKDGIFFYRIVETNGIEAVSPNEQCA